MIKYGSLGGLLVNLMYKDKLTASRKETVRNSDGSKDSKLLDSFLQNEPCLVCETTKDSSRNDNLDVAHQELTVTVYCSSKLDIKQGDVLELSVMDDYSNVRKTIKGFAAQPTFFSDHLQIDLYDWSVK